MFATTWFFCWSVFSNDYDDFNTFIYEETGIWFAWGVLILSIFVVIMFYLLVLFFSGVTLIACNKSKQLHLCHKISVIIILALCVAAYVLISLLWEEELYASVVALTMMGQWFHICLLCVLTLSSWLLFYEIMLIKNKKAWIFANFCVIAVFLFVCFLPLFLHPPCVGSNKHEIQKPRILAHRLGISKYAPENTILSYQEANKICIDFDLESDVSISYDGVPFLFHDTKHMKRTTNVETVFPNLTNQYPELFTWDQLQQLDAGSWFLEQDPFRTVRSMSDEYKAKIKQQKIPSLLEIANLINKNGRNQSIMFDLFRPVTGHPFAENYTEVVLNTLLDAGLPQHQILWLPPDKRSLVHSLAPDIRMVSAAAPIEYLEYANISIVNVAYSQTTPDSISRYVQNNISVIQYRIETPWLFSYAWCQRISYVTSHSCHLLKDVSEPVWTLTSGGYIALWVCMDILFFAIFTAIFFIQYQRSDCMFLPISRKFRNLPNSLEFDNFGLEMSEP